MISVFIHPWWLIIFYRMLTMYSIYLNAYTRITPHLVLIYLTKCHIFIVYVFLASSQVKTTLRERSINPLWADSITPVWTDNRLVSDRRSIDPIYHNALIYSRFSWNSEADASEFQENREEIIIVTESHKQMCLWISKGLINSQANVS